MTCLLPVVHGNGKVYLTCKIGCFLWKRKKSGDQKKLNSEIQFSMKVSSKLTSFNNFNSFSNYFLLSLTALIFVPYNNCLMEVLFMSSWFDKYLIEFT